MNLIFHKRTYFSRILFLVLIITCGIFIAGELNIKLNPEQKNREITIKFTWKDVSARIIENEVTSKIEGLVSSLGGVKSLGSTTHKGFGIVKAGLDRFVEVDTYRFLLSSSLRRLWESFPDGVSYPEIIQGKLSKETKNVLVISLTKNKYQGELYRYANTVLRKKFSNVKGLREVRITGGSESVVEIQLIRDKLKAIGLSMTEISKQIRDQLLTYDVGCINSNTQRGKEEYNVVLRSTPKTNQSLNKITIQNKQGKIINLSDISEIKQIIQYEKNVYRINGKNTIFINFIPDSYCNHLKLVNSLKEKIKKISTEIPDGIGLNIDYDSTEYVKIELGKILIRAIFSIVSLFLLIFFVRRNRNYLLLILITLSANITISIIFYFLSKTPIHFFTISGISLSLGMLIDNSVMLIDHWRYKKDFSILPALIIANITTILALLFVIINSEAFEEYWYDFAKVIVVNIFCSIICVIIFLPPLLKILPVSSISRAKKIKHLKFAVRFKDIYSRFIKIIIKRKIIVIIIFILMFGVPTFLMPNKLNNDNYFANIYNPIVSNSWFESFRSNIDPFLGGTLKLFLENVYQDRKMKMPDQINLTLRAKIEKGGTLKQLDKIIKTVEGYLNTSQVVDKFETNLHDKSANLKIYFSENNDKNNLNLFYDLFEYVKKFGGVEWNLSFNDEHLNEQSKLDRNSIWKLQFYGYNYDDLLSYVRNISDDLTANPRIKNLIILAENSLFSEKPSASSLLKPDRLKLRNNNINTQSLFSIVNQSFRSSMFLGEFKFGATEKKLYLNHKKSTNYSWQVFNEISKYENHSFRINEFAGIERTKLPMKIVRTNQEYQLCLNMDIIGSGQFGRNLLNDHIKKWNNTLPPGYRVEFGKYNFNDNSNFWLIFILTVIVFIYIVTAFIFDSFKMPFWVIITIPLSYIGVFLSYLIFDISFDQGGYAAFLLVGGVSVNVTIFILDQFRYLKLQFPKNSSIKNYLKAWNIRIIPLLFTIFSSITGFIPFLFGSRDQIFWFSFSSGMIGGLIFSIPVITVFLPLCVVNSKDV